ncbi:unnamed protein product [Caenorhabditis sp. 36 PRJEB53466]|nr:unnamed protein product [Caenorhabditis sp. 36 PRJEB53466]
MSDGIDCSHMVDLSTSVFLRTSLAANLVVAIFALPVLFWATWKMWSMKYSKLFHVNFKIILQLHMFGFMLHCTGRCFILRLMYNTGLWITHSTAIALIVERWLATKRSVTYEQDSVLFGVFLVLMQFVVTVIPLGLLYSNSTFHGTTMYYCVTAQAVNPVASIVSAALSICFQVTARVSFHFLFHLNKVRIADAYSDEKPVPLQHLRQSAFHSTLSNRYQLEQNISSITCLKTFANLSSAYVIFQNACYILIMIFASGLQPFQYFAFVELNGSFPLYSIFTVAIMCRSMTKVRNRVGEKLAGHLKTSHHLYIENFRNQIA